MPARVVVVLNDPEVAKQTVDVLAAEGCDAATLPDSMVALHALEGAVRIEVLVTTLEHGDGKPNGIALARMTKVKRPGIKVVFVGESDLMHYTAGLGDFIASPVAASEIAAKARQMLEGERGPN
jgi:DNA-binding NtrC family response regulator